MIEQRWRGRSQRWVSPGAHFDPARHDVRLLSTESEARSFVVRHHYSGTWPAARFTFGLFRDGALAGVAVLGVPVQAKVLTSPFPTLKPYAESIELSRLVLLDEVEFNAESWMASRVFRTARELGIRGVVAFSDPVPRQRADGSTVMPGHVGTIYQALGAHYCGRGTARTLLVLPDGATFNARTASKVRARERGWQYAVERLVALGATPPPAGRLDAWLPGALDAVGAARVRHGGNHRYVFALDRRVPTPLGGAYPKSIDTERCAA